MRRLLIVAMQSVHILTQEGGLGDDEVFGVRQVVVRALFAAMLLTGSHPTTGLAQNSGAQKYAPSDLQPLIESAQRLFMEGKYAEATLIAQEALALSERVLDKEHPDTLKRADALAGLYQAQRRYEEAESLYRRVLEVKERILGPDHPDTLHSVDNLAGLHYARGHHIVSHWLFERRPLAAGKLMGDKEQPAAIDYDMVRKEFNRTHYREAEPLYERVLKARERVLGEDHPETLISVNHLAELYQTQKRYSEAETLYKRALAAKEKVLGRDHLNTLDAVNNLAMLYDAQGRSTEAEALYNHVLEARERLLGSEHPTVLTSINNLAELYRNHGYKGEKIEPLLMHVIKTRDHILGKEHPDTLASVKNLADFYSARGRETEAEPLYERIRAKNFPYTNVTVERTPPRFR
jgi:tetratricopeptide (TPR) repeat protein